MHRLITARVLIQILLTWLTHMNAGQVGALLIYGANPVYTYYDAINLKQH